ncbi:hypothetical protein WICPIJ_007806 [Wickerhamomyces pijperi]|uniref:Uncharacterized protein n=1 Tax=Wickerhamomyces pijperi TaxID=599730 RepID=A0A9P8PZ79_WICPI|nr:hypothetical protein WICPIJ_007806 [Wickerhamomyces pijperi]
MLVACVSKDESVMEKSTTVVLVLTKEESFKDFWSVVVWRYIWKSLEKSMSLPAIVMMDLCPILWMSLFKIGEMIGSKYSASSMIKFPPNLKAFSNVLTKESLRKLVTVTLPFLPSFSILVFKTPPNWPNGSMTKPTFLQCSKIVTFSKNNSSLANPHDSQDSKLA